MYRSNDAYWDSTVEAWVRTIGRLTVCGLAVGMLACTKTEKGTLSPEIPDPSKVRTAEGALARYRGTLALVPEMLEWLMTTTGVLTDELASLPAPLGLSRQPYSNIDSHQDLSAFDAAYRQLHRLRGQAREARGFLQAYAPDSSSAQAGHMYALEGYAEILLADVFCSGIPLSTVDFDGDYTLAAGSSTTEVYAHADTLFDSALARTADNDSLRYLAAVGKGRALLALGRYAEAAAAVAAVPDGYRYRVVFIPKIREDRFMLFADDRLPPTGLGYRNPATPSVADNEGGIGLDYRSSGDPRTAATALGTDPFGHTMFFPNKYPIMRDFIGFVMGDITLTLADGIEARLIEAEAALQAGDAAWLTKLNQLRQTRWPTTTLPAALVDPGTNNGRVDLLFRERAFWLFLTAHRQGDLRRLVREYRRPAEGVYPTGLYQGTGGAYGPNVVAQVPQEERVLNPRYTGCLSS